jgi:hypothetical protein
MSTGRYRQSLQSADRSVEGFGDTPEEARADAERRMFGRGGFVRGPGARTSDDVPAVLAPGEVPVSRERARQLGLVHDDENSADPEVVDWHEPDGVGFLAELRRRLSRRR